MAVVECRTMHEDNLSIDEQKELLKALRQIRVTNNQLLREVERLQDGRWKDWLGGAIVGYLVSLVAKVLGLPP